MKFNSVKEYFYKLNNTAYQLMMLPLFLFIGFYAQSYFFKSKPLLNQGLSPYVWIGLIVVSVTILTVVHIFKKRNAIRIAAEVGLGLKLEKLGTLLIKCMAWKVAATLLMPLGLFVTGHLVFSILFIVALLWFFVQWPTPRKVCGLLKLKGDEREMVISRGEAFK